MSYSSVQQVSNSHVSVSTCLDSIGIAQSFNNSPAGYLDIKHVEQAELLVVQLQQAIAYIKSRMK